MYRFWDAYHIIRKLLISNLIIVLCTTVTIQSKTTEYTMDIVEQNIDCYTNRPDAKSRYKKSGIILDTHSDAYHGGANKKC